jgi:predicted DNA-binding protein YlxM (UPF0122 family)
MAKGNGNVSMTQKVFRLLNEAFMDNASIVEAAIYAGISKTTLYDYIKANPDYSERIKALGKLTGLNAKRNIRKEIESGKIPVSQWWLERKDSEFKPKQDLKLDASSSLLDAIMKKRAGDNKKDG